ncbi:YkgJ family cysteine cluster protein [Adlercreutzia sp. ZJ242]|uniref:YkgJ family cysteine cluster protein n=1 Tax=Adlercreutzia sp. ZJ242 TaxID=2709409 RepID=UPI0013EDCF8D|nr:YkgJ family cysteine cluster protein [Adlercreutzia sp. ZJ242]
MDPRDDITGGADDASAPLRFDGDNSYPDCEQCGRCCGLNVISASPDEVARMRAYMAEHGIAPRNYRKERCCFSEEGGICRIWEARPQICRLYNCRVPRLEILRRNPDIVVDDDKPLIDLHDTFILGDASDPRYRPQHSLEEIDRAATASSAREVARAS